MKNATKRHRNYKSISDGDTRTIIEIILFCLHLKDDANNKRRY